MMKKISFSLLFILSFWITQLFAQDKIFTPEEMMSNRSLYPSSLQNLQWIGTTDTYSYVTAKAIVTGNVKSPVRDTLLRLADINIGLNTLKIDNFRRFPAVTWLNNESFAFSQKNKLIRYQFISKKFDVVNSYDENAGNVDIDYQTGNIAYTKENNLFVSINGKEINISNETNKGIVYGSERVHRNEWGIEKGTFWSPKGNLLAFYRMDETMVADYPLVDIDTRIATVENTKYPMAGMTSHQVTVGIYNPLTNTTIYLKTGEPADQFLTNVSWSPDEKYVFIAVLNRQQNHMWLNQYDAITGNFVKTLFEEQNEKYVEPLHGIYFLKTKPQYFVWQSQRDGYNHLYLYNTDGKLISQLTKGNWVVLNYLGTNDDCNKLYYLCTKDSPVETQLYCLDMRNGKFIKLSHEPGTHTAYISASGNYIIDQYSSLNVSSEYVMLDGKGKKLFTIQENKDPLKDYKLGETTLLTLKSKDGSDLYCRMIKPADFDSTKKYPVFLYVYGGPHSQLVSNTWLGGAGLFLNYMAQKGYLVFTMDNHGTSNRGLAFEQAIHRNLGTIEVDDQMLGVKYLKTLPYVDTIDFHIDGWSYGGFMTISMMLKNPGVFKCATAGGPVIDWKYYEVMYGERYMDTPEENPDGYKNACLLNYVDKLNAKLLIFHGTVDGTVVWQNSLQFIKTCVDKGKQVDYFVYPGHEHNVRGIDRAHLFRKIEEYHNLYR